MREGQQMSVDSARRGQQMSINIIMFLALFAIAAVIGFYAFGRGGDAVKSNLNDSVCIAAVNVASIAMGSHEKGTGSDAWVQKGSLDFEEVCCGEMRDPLKGDEEDVLGYLSKQINTTCELGKKLRDVDYFKTSDDEFCYMGALKVKPSEDIVASDILKLQGDKCINEKKGSNGLNLVANEEARYRLTFGWSRSDSEKTIRNVVYLEKLSQDE